MLRISELKRPIRHHLGCDRAQPRDDPARLVEQPPLGVARGKKTGRVRESRRGFDSNPQSGACFPETTAEEQSATAQVAPLSRARPRAEAQGCLSMLDREIRSAGPQPE